MGEVIATRAAYGKALVEFGSQYPNLVVMDADLASATMTNTFAKAFPEKFFDLGIAEANMVGVAAGLATCGKLPFVNSFAMFSAGRAWEQVRNSLAYPHLNVKVVGSHGGLSVGEDGATHQCIEDFALMRAIPGMLVLCPCDGYEMHEAVKALLEYDGPAYMRLGRLAVETVTDTIPGYQFQLGKGATLRDGGDVTIIAVGMMVQEALRLVTAVWPSGKREAKDRGHSRHTARASSRRAAAPARAFFQNLRFMMLPPFQDLQLTPAAAGHTAGRQSRSGGR